MDLIKTFKQISKTDTLIAGGKGASLGEMTQAKIPVPEGFVILSKAFNQFIEETDLNVEIEAILDNVDIKEVHTIENASEKIQAMILSKEIPKSIKTEILKFHKNLNCKFVAVRSSATSEDSASAAWAGQLNSFLNTTKETLLENVKKCWASLFTSRAIFYRLEKKLNKDKISVAVVVQKMVNSEKSGIAFSVHPVTQDENQIIIEAGFGLGEAIVSGSITPDSYVVDKQGFSILDITVNEQTKALYKKAKGGNEWKELGKKGKKQVLTEKEIIELSKLIVKIENHYGFPCDIEWAKEKGKFYIVQSRPITTISKAPETLQFKNLVLESKDGSNMEIEDDSQYFKIVSRKTAVLARALIILGYCNPYFYQKIYGFSPNLRVFYDWDRGIYIDKNGMNIEKENALKRTKTNYNYLNKVVEQGEKHGEELIEFGESLREYKLDELSNDKLKELLIIFMKKIMQMCAYIIFPLSIQSYLENTLKDELHKKLNDSKQEKKYFETLCTPIKENGHFFEQESILSLAIDFKNRKKVDTALRKKIQQHLDKNGALAMKFGLGKPWSEKEIIERITHLSKENPEKKLQDLYNFHRESREKVEKIIKEFKSKKIKELVELTRKYIWFRTYRTEIISNSFTIALPLFKEIGRRFNLSYQEVLSCTPNELENFDFPNKEKLSKRNKIILMHSINGLVYFNENNKAKQILENLKNKISQKNISEPITKSENITGVIAYKGKIRGKVKIVYDNSHLKKVEKGDILVSPMTTPDFVPAMEKASAFITDEGGILCHAAIVSREMQKPCIIGTGIATSILKDGDLVEVDANQGIVKILKKSKN